MGLDVGDFFQGFGVGTVRSAKRAINAEEKPNLSFPAPPQGNVEMAVFGLGGEPDSAFVSGSGWVQGGMIDDPGLGGVEGGPQTAHGLTFRYKTVVKGRAWKGRAWKGWEWPQAGNALFRGEGRHPVSGVHGVSHL